MERFYLNRETGSNNLWITVKDKQKKTTLELVHNSAYYSTSYFKGQVKSL